MKRERHTILLIIAAALFSISACKVTRQEIGFDAGEPDAGNEDDPCKATPGDLGCECGEKTSCAKGFVCDDETELCREERVCDTVSCDADQICQPVGDEDAECRDACAPGFEANQQSTACEVVEDASCIIGRDASIALACEDRFRACIDEDDGAQCGECYKGYTLIDDTCRPVRTCDKLNCKKRFRKCLPPRDHQDAECSECEPGYVQEEGKCVTDSKATCEKGDGGIGDECAKLKRYCVAATSDEGARCGECLDGYRLAPETGSCEPIESCKELNCGLESRGCEETPYPACTGCLAGTVEDKVTGECLDIIECDDLDCPEGTVCEPALEGQHAYCYDPHGCDDDQIWNPDKGVCVQCPVCGDDEGESARRWPRLTKGSDRCICATEPGYFFSDSMDLKIYPCDKDGDGWIRAEAKSPMEKAVDDPIRLNARCDLRKVHRFLLENQQGKTKEVVLEKPALLFEPTILDDDELLATQADTFLGEEDDGRELFAAELNPLTKACVNHIADFNQNGIADVREQQTDDTGAETWRDAAQFLPMTYFVELYNGWYEAKEDGGVYHIQEKRVMDEYAPFDSIAIGQVDEAPEDYWKECPFLDEAAKSADPETPAAGMDFARFEDAEMTLSNQYKCVIIVNDPAEESEQRPTNVVKADLDSPCLLSNCWAGETSMSRPPDDNPKSPEILCDAVEDVSSLEIGHVGWVSVDYSVL
jgi:hypothetical protein